MKIGSIGFIGSGRVASFMLEGFERAGKRLSVTLSDADPEVSARLAAAIPGARDAGADFAAATDADVVFLALHPQAVAAGAAAIAGTIRPDSIIVSLAPKVRIAALASALGRSGIARFLPSAPSAIGEGYNPIAFASGLGPEERRALLALLGTLGRIPEVEESSMEAYAVLCAMGPTYLWPLFDAMEKLGTEFALDETEARRAIAGMAAGAAELFGNEDRTFASLMDMIPVKPMAEDEGRIRELLNARLRGIYGKLTS